MNRQGFLIGLIITFLLLPISPAIGATDAGSNIKLELYPDNKVINVLKDSTSQNLNLEAAPYNPDGVTLIPVRGVLDQLGANVNWVADKRQVEISADKTKIVLTLGSNTALLNNVPVTMDRAAQVVNNRTMIPLRFLAENMGYYVKWYPAEKKIEIINQAVASVNGQAISRTDYERNSVFFKYSLEKQYGNKVWDQKDLTGVSLKDKFPAMVIDELISQETLYQKAGADKITVSESEINTGMENYQNAIKGDPVLAEQAKQNSINDSFLRNKVQKELIANNYKTRYLSNLNISEQQIKAIYEKNISSFQQEQVQASHILIKTVPEKTDQDKEANQQAYQKATEILKRAQAGEDFAALAKQYSQDPGSGPQGGDLGYFSKGTMVQEFETAAFRLQKGQISGLVKTVYGYHIIKVADHRTQTLPFEQLSGSIKASLQNQSFQDHVKQLNQAAKAEIYGVR